jgi:hypothetical protein
MRSSSPSPIKRKPTASMPAWTANATASVPFFSCDELPFGSDVAMKSASEPALSGLPVVFWPTMSADASCVVIVGVAVRDVNICRIGYSLCRCDKSVVLSRKMAVVERTCVLWWEQATSNDAWAGSGDALEQCTISVHARCKRRIR